MVPPIKYVYTLAFLAALAYGAPVSESAADTVPLASDDPNYLAYPPGTSGPAQPIRGDLGAAIIGPQNTPIQQQNPDIIASPSTDSGNVCVL
jgi:hypothetical protein